MASLPRRRPVTVTTSATSSSPAVMSSFSSIRNSSHACNHSLQPARYPGGPWNGPAIAPTNPPPGTSNSTGASGAMCRSSKVWNSGSSIARLRSRPPGTVTGAVSSRTIAVASPCGDLASATDQGQDLVALSLHVLLGDERLEVQPQERLGVGGADVEVPVGIVDGDAVEPRDLAVG